jgi:hypothetical protein
MVETGDLYSDLIRRVFAHLLSAADGLVNLCRLNET